jgi:fructosamine-3-kinase
MSWKNSVIKSLEKQFGDSIELISVSPVSGGDINEAFRFETSSGDFFVKKNSASRFPEMFEKEARGLKLLADAKEIPIPEVIFFGEEDDIAFLVLKFIESAPKQNNIWNSFGEKLAQLHKYSSEKFGLDHDNYIGSLHQSNNYHLSWTDFFREERLEVQVKIARDDDAIGRETVNAFERFYKRLDEIFPVEPPALIHGDLWSGNFMVNEIGEAVIIDPAVYYGHREMDLGMSQLFGGFSNEFYEAYQAHYPLENGWQQRMDYCNLYPLMVHVNLFGGG